MADRGSGGRGDRIGIHQPGEPPDQPDAALEQPREHEQVVLGSRGQVVELIVGAVQLVLMGTNFRDGLRLAGKLRPQAS